MRKNSVGLVTVSQLATILRNQHHLFISKNTLRKYIRKGKIKAFKLDYLWLMAKEDLKQIISTIKQEYKSEEYYFKPADQ